MSLTLTGEKVRIFKNEKQTKNGGKFYTYQMSVASKDKEGNWLNAYMDCIFKKDAVVNNKMIIDIKNAFPTVSEYQGKKYVKWFILDFTVVDEGEVQRPVSDSEADDFMDLDDVEGELPFN